MAAGEKANAPTVSLRWGVAIVVRGDALGVMLREDPPTAESKGGGASPPWNTPCIDESLGGSSPRASCELVVRRCDDDELA